MLAAVAVPGPVLSGPSARPALRAPSRLAEGLPLLGDDEVSEHVEGVAVRVHSHHPASLLVHLEEPGVIQADDPHLGPLSAPQADSLATENKAQGEVTGMGCG